MFFSPFIALRYLKPKRTFVSIITVISVVGVMLGVWLTTVVMAVFSGYGHKIKENILGFEPHLELRAGGYIEDFVPLLAALQETKGVVSCSPFVLGSVIMEFQGMRNAPIIRAIQPPEPGSEEYKRLSQKIAKRPNPKYDPEIAPNEPREIPAGDFRLDPYSVVVGDVMAKSLGLVIGSKILLYSPKDVGSIMELLDDLKNGDDTKRKAAEDKIKEATVPQEVSVTGIYDSGNYDVDANFIFLALETGQVLYNFDLDECHGIAIRTSDAFQADAFKNDILVALGMGEWKTAGYSPASIATQDVFRFSPITNFLLLLLLIGGVVGFFFFKKAWKTVLTGVLTFAAIVLGFQWINTFAGARDTLQYVEQNGDLPYQLLTWMQIHKSIFDAISTERQAMYLILFMIMIVSAFCIMNTMITVTFQKKAEIGLMKALGAREEQIANLFLLQGMVVGVIGVFVGLVIAKLTIWKRNAIATWLGKHFGIDMFSAEIYKVDGGLPAMQTLSDTLAISLVAFMACTLAALLPAIFASRLEPANALRSD
jgi:ABC-type lipoprotein release transport system permease subunit